MDLWARDPSEAMIAEDIRASREKFPRGERYVPPTTQEEADASQTNRVWTRPRREEWKAERFRADTHSAPVRSSPQTRVLAGLGEALGAPWLFSLGNRSLSALLRGVSVEERMEAPD